MAPVLRYVLVAVLSAAVALGASHLAQGWMPARHGSELHQLVHGKLDLTPDQDREIRRLEQDFARTRAGLDAQLRAANIALAKAIAREHKIGPQVTGAVDASHMAMGELQKATLAHVFAMRAVLTPQQQAIFDREISRALTSADGP
ncbi:MAG: Spy/CpxP family protein refolding chaperone [Novosphingobium sp.]